MAAGPAPVDLGSCAHFEILSSGAGVTTTGGGIINGDVGLYPAGPQGIPPSQINGTVYNGGPIAQQAQDDLTLAYNDAKGRSVDRITVAGNIGGQTLAPGLYWSASSLQITGDLTLDAGSDSNAVWIFQMTDSTLTTAAGAPGFPGSQVLLAGGAQARNIFWQVGSSATIGTYSAFKGTILAQVSITMNTDSTTDGRALARTGAVTFNGETNSLPLPEAPRFTGISRTNTGPVTVVLKTTPYVLLTLRSAPDLRLTNWTTLATATPVTTPWTFTDETATANVTQCFYRAFLTP